MTSAGTAQPWFVPASTLNGLRRATIEALDAARLAATSGRRVPGRWSRRWPTRKTA
jgi:hypothetical protein